MYSKEWGANERPDLIKDDMVRLIGYFRPRTGYGDAFDSAFLYDLNKKLYTEGITSINVTRFKNKAGPEGWDNWYIKPLRFTGPQKHTMHERMQKYIFSRVFRYPSIIEDDDRYVYLERLVNQFGNISAERGLAGYNKYDILNALLGDDLVESCICCVWAHEEIAGMIEVAGGSVPQMRVGASPILTPLGPQFLNDGRKFGAPKGSKDLYQMLRDD